jgi:hypothetical protein
MADEKIPDKNYYEELEKSYQDAVRRNPQASEEECWEFAKLWLEEGHAIDIARARAISEGKEPFRAQMEDALRRLKEKDALKIN